MIEPVSQAGSWAKQPTSRAEFGVFGGFPCGSVEHATAGGDREPFEGLRVAGKRAMHGRQVSRGQEQSNH
jgi:hypothetical protein